MSKQVQLRRGTTAQNAAFTGAQGELVADTQLNKLILHDGTTIGGHKVASEAYVDLLLASDTGNVTFSGNTISTLNTNETLHIIPNGSGIVQMSSLSVTAPITGNITGTATSVISNAQPNITSVGTLTNLTVTTPIIGNIAGTASNNAIVYDRVGTLSESAIYSGETTINGTVGHIVTLPTAYSNITYKVQLTYSGAGFNSSNSGTIYANVVGSQQFTIYSTNAADTNKVFWFTNGSEAA